MEQQLKTASIRRAALVGIVGAAATAIGGFVVQAFVQPSTTVPQDMWSYPLTSSELVRNSVVYAVLHVLVFVGLLGFARSGLAGTGRAARIGLALAIAGTALLFASELASIPIRDQHADDTGAAVVGGMYGLASVLIAIGFVTAGITTVRARLWTGWRRWTPLAVGIWMGALIGLGTAGAIAAGVAGYGLCSLALYVALYTQPTPSPTGTAPITVREHVS
jgi:hypothetical protein